MPYKKLNEEVARYYEASQIYVNQLKKSADKMQVVENEVYEVIANIMKLNRDFYAGKLTPEEYMKKMKPFKPYLAQAMKIAEKESAKKPSKDTLKNIGRLEEVLWRFAAVILLSFASISVASSLFNKSSITGYVVLSEGFKISNLFILNFIALLIIIVVLIPKGYNLSKKVAKKTL